MKIAVNATSLLSPATGIGQYTFGLCKQLAAEDGIELHYFYGGKWSQTLSEPGLTTPSRLKWLAKTILPGGLKYSVRDAFYQYRFQRGYNEYGFELYHEMNFIPIRYSGKTIVTIHDLSFLKYPEMHPGDRAKYLNKQIRRSVDESAAIITDSAYIKNELVSELGVDEKRIFPIPLGKNSNFSPRGVEQCERTLKKLGLNYSSYLLTVGTLEPRKNLVRTLRAFAMLPKEVQKQFPLVITGMAGWNLGEIERKIAPLAEAGVVIRTGYVSLEVLAEPYSACTLFLFPSIYEGFGLPVLEAMASGAPVITSQKSSMTEIAGKTATYVDPTSTENISAAIKGLLEDENSRRLRVESGLARASEFSWEACAQSTLAVYKSVM